MQNQPLPRFSLHLLHSPPSPHTNTHTATQPHSPYRLSRHHQTPPHTPTLRHTHTQPNRVASAQPERHEALHLLGTLIRTVPGPNRQPREISFREIENSFRDPSPKQEVRGMSRGEVGKQFKSSINPRARHQEPQHPLHSTPQSAHTPALTAMMSSSRRQTEATPSHEQMQFIGALREARRHKDRMPV